MGWYHSISDTLVYILFERQARTSLFRVSGSMLPIVYLIYLPTETGFRRKARN